MEKFSNQPNESRLTLTDVLEEAERLKNLALANNNAHYNGAHNLENYNKYMGVFSAILSAIVGTSIFTALANASNNTKNFDYIRIGTGILSVLATIFVTLPMVFKFSEIANKHRRASTDYLKVINALRAFILKYKPFELNATLDSRDNALRELEDINELIVNITYNSPTISGKILERIHYQYHIWGLHEKSAY